MATISLRLSDDDSMLIKKYAELKNIMFNNNTYYTKENIKNEIIKQRDISNYKFNLL